MELPYEGSDCPSCRGGHFLVVLGLATSETLRKEAKPLTTRSTRKRG